MTFQLIEKISGKVVQSDDILMNQNGILFKDGIDVTTLYAVRKCSEVPDRCGQIIYEGNVLEVVTLDTNETLYFEVAYGEFQDENAITNDKTLGWYIKGKGMDFSLLQEYDGEQQTDTALKIVGYCFNNQQFLFDK